MGNGAAGTGSGDTAVLGTGGGGELDGAALGASGDARGRSAWPSDMGVDKQRKGKGGGAASCGHGVRRNGGRVGSEALRREARGRKEDEGGTDDCEHGSMSCSVG